MPGTGGRFGWNEPPPAEITITLHSNTLPASVVTRNAGSPIFSIFSTISLRWNVVDRFLRIELGALSADLVENVDQVRLHVEEAQFEDGEKSARTSTNNQHIGFDRVAHIASYPLDGAPERLGRVQARLSNQRWSRRKAIIGGIAAAAISTACPPLAHPLPTPCPVRANWA